MKKTSIVCAVLAGALGCATIASAQPTQDPYHNGAGDRIVPGTLIPQQHHTPGYDGPAYRVVPGYAYDYGQRSYRDHDRRDHDRRDHDGPRGYAYGYHGHFRRGGFLPYEYRQPAYYMDWRSYPGLYAPPRGYQWVNVGGDILLVALATGLIANLVSQ